MKAAQSEAKCTQDGILTGDLEKKWDSLQKVQEWHEPDKINEDIMLPNATEVLLNRQRDLGPLR